MAEPAATAAAAAGTQRPRTGMKQDVAIRRQPSLIGRALRWGGVSYLFILPAVAVYVAVILRPDILGLKYAFTNWNGLDRHYRYVGLANFTRMFGDIQVRSAISTTLIIAAALVVNTKSAVAQVERQGNMVQARQALESALHSLQVATDDKGGHKVKAIQLIEAAIAEVNEGIRYANTH